MYTQQRTYRMFRHAAVAVALACAAVLMVAATARSQDQAEQERLVADYQRAEKLLSEGKYAQAAKLYESITKAAEKLFGPDDGNTLDLMYKRGLVLAVLGRYEESKELYSRCVRVARDRYSDDPRLPRYQNSLGNVYRLLGQLEKADNLISESLRLREKLGPGHEVEVAESLHARAVLLQERGELTEAEPLYERCLKLRKEKLGEDSAAVADTLDLMGQLYTLLFQDEKALKCYRQGLKIRLDRFGSEDLATAASYLDLATFYMEREQFKRAEPLLGRALEVFEKQLGSDAFDTAKVYNNLGWTYLNLHKNEKAEQFQEKAVQTWSKKLSADHPTRALGLYNQAILYFVEGRDEKAESIQRRALRMRERSLGKDHFTAAESLFQLARVDACAGRWDKAAESFDQAGRRVRRYTARVLPALSEPQQLDFLKHRHEEGLHAALSLAWQQRNDPKLAEMSAAWVLNGKAISQEVLAAQILLARNSSDKDASQLLKQLRSIRSEIAALAALPADDKLREQRKSLMEREEELVKRLGRITGRALDADPWVGLDQVRKALPANTVLIEIARFPVCDFQARSPSWTWKEERYAAWIIPALGGPVRLVDLGSAREVENAVKRVRKGIEDSYQHAREKGYEEAEKELMPEIEKLASLVLRPLEKHAGTGENWVLSADAELWLIPWAALTLADGRYAVEKYQFRYVVSGRDLAVRPHATGKARTPVMVAGPDFDLRPEEARRFRKDDAREEQRRGTPASLYPTSLDEIGRARALPGARAEAEVIKPYLERYTGQKPLVYTDERAQEGVVKSLRGPGVLMLSTHGFFLENAPTTEAGPDRSDSKARMTNPLLRCGLLLAGCNRRANKFVDPEQDDGILTGLEIVGCDLRGTGLVVLSACETGLGVVRNGEGVSGLRQAFQLAGAESVLATLWSVEDSETARLMGSYFSHLAGGKSRAEALRQAQRDRIKAQRERNGATHPFLWAAFTLTGQ